MIKKVFTIMMLMFLMGGSVFAVNAATYDLGDGIELSFWSNSNGDVAQIGWPDSQTNNIIANNYYYMELAKIYAQREGYTVTNSVFTMGEELRWHAVAYKMGFQTDHANPADVELNY